MAAPVTAGGFADLESPGVGDLVIRVTALLVVLEAVTTRARANGIADAGIKSGQIER